MVKSLAEHLHLNYAVQQSCPKLLEYLGSFVLWHLAINFGGLVVPFRVKGPDRFGVLNGARDRN
jgi:hypothetical protein